MSREFNLLNSFWLVKLLFELSERSVFFGGAQIHFTFGTLKVASEKKMDKDTERERARKRMRSDP